MTSKPLSPFRGLWLKLTLAFLLVALLGVGLVALLANQATKTGFHQYMIRGQLMNAQDLVFQLETFYAEQGEWTGVAAVFGERRGSGRGAGWGAAQGTVSGQAHFALVDEQGLVVAGSSSDQLGQYLESQMLAGGIPLYVEGKAVGILVVTGGEFGAAEQESLKQVNKAIVFGAGGSAVAALLLGAFFAWRITNPVRKLIKAAERVAAGDLSSSVTVNSRDEIGQLGKAFNQMASSLAVSDELRRRMAADIAHELRTPLSIIRGQVEAVLDGLFPPDAEHLTPIHEETLLLNRLVEDLRTLAQAEAGQLPLQKAMAEPDKLLAQVSRFAPLASEKNIKIEILASPDLPPILVDQGRIEQVLANLISNAIRHTPENGKIVVQASAGTELVVTVKDSGPGIPDDELAFVFERFWRGEKSRTRDRGGVGLGLSIARHLVEAHGGRIWVINNPGGGSIFGFSLPFQDGYNT